MTDPARIVRVVDVETSGLPENEFHAICEIGWVDLDLQSMTIGNPVTFLVNPGHPIPPHIRAIHHISDKDVADAMPPDQALTQLMKGMGPDDVFAAHNAKFEQAFIGGGGRRWICSLKCSWRAWPEHIAHNNQSLRYSLGIDDEPDFPHEAAMPPHRALPDAWTTAFIVRRLFAGRTVEKLVEASSQPGMLPRFNFGKHKGKTPKEILALDSSYLSWIVEKSDMDEDIKFTAKTWLKRGVAA